MIVRRALRIADIRVIMEAADRPWQTVTLSNAANLVDPTVMAWETDIPAGLEGLYQVDLRGTDSRGNSRRINSVWNGPIDTLAPRLTIGAATTGRAWDDPATGAARYDIGYTLHAEDLHLDLDSFVTGCNAGTQPARTYLDGLPWQETYFPDMTWRSELQFDCQLWSNVANPTVQIDACDLMGNCTSETATVDTTGVDTTQRDPMIVWPTNGLVLDASDAPDINAVLVDVQIAADAATALEWVKLFVNNGEEYHIDYAQGDTVLRVLETIQLTLPGENNYTLNVQSKAYGQAARTGPTVTFSLDTTKPEGEISTDVFTMADETPPGSGLMFLAGQAKNPMGVSTVQVRIAGGMWQDVNLDDNASNDWVGWHTVLYVGEEMYGQTVAVEMRVLDWSGTGTVISKPILVDIESPNGAMAGFASESVSVVENAGTRTLTVNLSTASDTPVTVQYATSDGSAVAGADYTAQSGTLTFNVGVTSQTISIPILDDSVVEGDETFTVQLSNAAGAGLGLNVVTVTITDDDSDGFEIFLPVVLR